MADLETTQEALWVLYGDGEATQTKLLVFFSAFLRERQDFRKVEAEYAAWRAAQEIPAYVPSPSSDFNIEEAVKKLDELPALDIAQGIEDFFREIGIVKDSNAGNEEPSDLLGNADIKITWDETLLPQQDLELLASALPNRELLAIPTARYTSGSQDTPQQYKARILDTLARLALNPALTLPIARIFNRIIVDIAARWLLLLGFDGQQYQSGNTGHEAKAQLLAVLAAFARLLKRFPHIYP